MADDELRSMWTSFHAALIAGQRWEEFDSIYRPVIRAWCAKHGLQPADADDLTQQVFAKLCQVLPTYDKERGDFRGWLWTIVHRQICDFFEKRSRRPADEGSGS